MKHLFSLDGPVYKAMSFISNLVILNLIWLLCCLPIVTIGTSTVALQYACLQIVRGNGSPVRHYLKSFRMNLLQGIGIWLIVLAVGAVLTVEALLIYMYDFHGRIIITILFVIFTIVFLNMCSFLFPLQAQFQNPIPKTLANAFLFSFIHIKESLSILFLNLIPIIVAILTPELFFRFSIMWFVVGIAAISYLIAKITNRVFLKYMDISCERSI